MIGFLFRAYPTLMTREPTIDVMDEIFAHDDSESHVLILRVIQTFLSTQALKAKESQQSDKRELFCHFIPGFVWAYSRGSVPSSDKVDINELVGNSNGFADSGCVPCLPRGPLSSVLRCPGQGGVIYSAEIYAANPRRSTVD
jgi:cohesin loading factor subunit SCC2